MESKLHLRAKNPVYFAGKSLASFPKGFVRQCFFIKEYKTKASEAASKLVLPDKVDLLVGSWTPTNINPVSALAETDLDTAYGHMKYNEDNISEVPVVTSQWKKGTDKWSWEKVIVSNTKFPEIKVEDKVFPIPGS